MSVIIVNDDNGRNNGILILIIQRYQAELFINQRRLMIVKTLEVLLRSPFFPPKSITTLDLDTTTIAAPSNPNILMIAIDDLRPQLRTTVILKWLRLI